MIRPPCSKPIVACFALALFSGSALAGERVAYKELGLSLTVPDGFTPDAERVKKDVVLAFQHAATEEAPFGMYIFVSRMHGVLRREQLDPKSLTAKNPQVTLFVESWKGFDIEVLRVPEQAGDLDVVTFNAQVPLRPEAVQISVAAEASREEEAKRVLRSVLASLDGQTNWLTTEERVERFISGSIKLAGTVAVLVLLAILVWRAVRRRKFSAP